MKRNARVIILLCMLLTACTYPQTGVPEVDSPGVISDSLQFAQQHHYSVNYNFSVEADSLQLAIFPKDSDSVSVYRGDLIVVADVLTLPEDSIDSTYVKVARDQETIGWIHESQLSAGVAPDDPISSFIYTFSNIHMLWFLILIGLGVLAYLFRLSRRKPLQFVHFNDIDSPYPALLCVLVAVSASFYGTIQHFVPDTWVHFYYYPTLNPFALPLGMSCFVACVWGILLLGIAAVEETFKNLSVVDAIPYLMGLMVVCVLNYIFFTYTIPYYIGYLFLVVYVVFAFRGISWGGYRCGACGHKLPQKHCKCPHCGTLNQ